MGDFNSRSENPNHSIVKLCLSPREQGKETIMKYLRMPRDKDEKEELSRDEWLKYVGNNYDNADELADSHEEVMSQFYIYWTEEE